MAQFDVHQNPSTAQRETFPYMVEIQSNLFGVLNTRLTMPLQRLPHRPVHLPRRLSTPIVIQGEALYLAPQQCAAFPLRALGKPITNIEDQQAIVLDALDAIVSGV